MSYADKLSRNLSDSPVTSMLEKQHGQGIFGLFNFKKKHTNGMWRGCGLRSKMYV